ncbi:MAG: hypothetical protein OEY28_11995, partial [Nitrospira sp.]|nr:hypothetical protein [Nitrospira sp.]
MSKPAATLAVIALAAVCLLTGCPGDDDDGGKKNPPPPSPVTEAEVLGPAPGGTADPDGGPAVALTVSGRVQYERLIATVNGLEAMPLIVDAAGVVVEAVVHNNHNSVIQSTSTDLSGNYSFSLSVNADFYIRARAQDAATGDDRVYHSQVVPTVVHAVSSPVINRAGGNQTVDITATASGPDIRSGAFAALDTVRGLRAQVASSFPALGRIDLFWGPENHGTSYQQTSFGQAIPINGTFFIFPGPFANPSIFLLGGRTGFLADSDHDEFDQTVIAHEWAHVFSFRESRDNNFGGPHAGEELLPSVAYSEGFA